jgi:serine/threonine-protein kinase HipA
MFRRACFNVFAHNRDDHARNFAFLMDGQGVWKPSPAYDLTYSSGPGGEHTMLIDTEGANPTRQHLEALAASVELKGAGAIIESVQGTIANFRGIADEAGLPKKQIADTAKRLGV